MTDAVLIYSTWPDAEAAGAAGAALVEEGLAACVNVLAPMTSIYRWRDAVERAAEVPMLVKTTAEAAPAVTARIAALHPYDVPAAVALPLLAAGSHAPFLEWIGDSVSRAAAFPSTQAPATGGG